MKQIVAIISLFLALIVSASQSYVPKTTLLKKDKVAQLTTTPSHFTAVATKLQAQVSPIVIVTFKSSFSYVYIQFSNFKAAVKYTCYFSFSRKIKSLLFSPTFLFVRVLRI